MMYIHCHPARPRMPSILSSRPEIGAPIALASGWARMKIPNTATRWRAGNQNVRYRMIAGKNPASAAPSRNRMM